MLGGAPESGKGHHSEVRGGLGELRAEESPDGQWSTPFFSSGHIQVLIQAEMFPRALRGLKVTGRG